MRVKASLLFKYVLQEVEIVKSCTYKILKNDEKMMRKIHEFRTFSETYWVKVRQKIQIMTNLPRIYSQFQKDSRILFSDALCEKP